MKIWPHYFTLALLLFLGPPVISGLDLATNPSVAYWIGPWGYLAVGVPVYLLMFHAIHLYCGAPRMVPVILGSVVPAVVLFIVANVHLSATGIVANMLMSNDCTTYSTKQNIHHSWLTAATLYEQCVNRTVALTALPYDAVLQKYRLHECDEFRQRDPDPWAEHRATWLYLQGLEEDHMCSGWCWQSRSLWSYLEGKDSCSTVAGAVLLTKVRPTAVQMMVVSLVGVLVACIGMADYSTRVRQETGEDWRQW